MKFEYKRPADTKIEAYGKVFEVPPRTSSLLGELGDIKKRITAAGDIEGQLSTILDGIALFIGTEATEEIFPRSDLKNLNTDEVSAFWLCLNAASEKEGQLILEKYAPKAANAIKVSSNPKK